MIAMPLSDTAEPWALALSLIGHCVDGGERLVKRANYWGNCPGYKECACGGAIRPAVHQTNGCVRINSAIFVGNCDE